MIIPTDRVIIPAKSVDETLSDVIRYALACGFSNQQVIVVANGKRADEMARIALDTASVRAVIMDELLDRTAPNSRTVAQRVSFIAGIERGRLHGKGAAMFVGTVTIAADKLPDTARIFFMDADIKEPTRPDPLCHLVYAWNHAPQTVRLIKLASLNRDNETIHTLCAQTDLWRYNQIGAFTWPLCGQQSLRWKDLKNMHMASGYSVEMSLIAELIDEADRCKKATQLSNDALFAEISIHHSLNDRPNSEHSTVRMYAGIGAYIKRRHDSGTKGQLLNSESLQQLNRDCSQALKAYLPTEPGETNQHGPTLHTIPIDATLPSVVQVM